MVSLKQVKASNALLTETTTPRTSVFIGATSGIGQLTLRALVATGGPLKIYLVGRPSSAPRSRDLINELHAINPRAEVVWLEGEISLLADARRLSDLIAAKESRLDLLFLTAGYAPFHGRKETAGEGLDVTWSLQYYSRMLFTLQLLPLLRRSEGRGRVVSVLGGGLERASSIDVNDIERKKPGKYDFMRSQMQCIAMNTLGMERLADENPDVAFVHSWPGWVDTGNVWRGVDANTWTAWLVWLFLAPLVRLFSIGDDASAQRHLFQGTSGAFGGRGAVWMGKPGVNTRGGSTGGLFLVNFKCDCTPNARVLPVLRERAGEKVWAHTMEVLEPHLTGAMVAAT